MSRSAGSAPRASAGNPSVIRFIHRIWSGSKGMGIPSRGASNITHISAEFVVKMYYANLRILS